MKKSPLIFAGVLLLATGACAYKVPVEVSAAHNVYANYEDPVPGRFVVFVESDDMTTTARVDGFQCSAHTFPVDARTAFEKSVYSTLENLVEELELVTVPMTREDMDASDTDYMIRVEGRDLDVTFDIASGFWSASARADVEVTVSMTVDGRDGRLLGATVEGDEKEESDTGGFCEGASTAIKRALKSAMEEAMERLGEKIANSPRLRKVCPTQRGVRRSARHLSFFYQAVTCLSNSRQASR